MLIVNARYNIVLISASDGNFPGTVQGNPQIQMKLVWISICSDKPKNIQKWQKATSWGFPVLPLLEMYKCPSRHLRIRFLPLKDSHFTNSHPSYFVPILTPVILFLNAQRQHYTLSAQHFARFNVVLNVETSFPSLRLAVQGLPTRFFPNNFYHLMQTLLTRLFW